MLAFASPTESKSTAASINQLLPKPKSLAERGTASTKPARALGIDGNILLTSDEVSTKLKEKEKKKKKKKMQKHLGSKQEKKRKRSVSSQSQRHQNNRQQRREVDQMMQTQTTHL